MAFENLSITITNTNKVTQTAVQEVLNTINELSIYNPVKITMETLEQMLAKHFKKVDDMLSKKLDEDAGPNKFNEKHNQSNDSVGIEHAEETSQHGIESTINQSRTLWT